MSSSSLALFAAATASSSSSSSSGAIGSGRPEGHLLVALQARSGRRRSRRPAPACRGCAPPEAGSRAIVVGQAEIACIMSLRPSSIFFAMTISPSRVSSSTAAHLAHVHAHRVGRAAELRVDGRERGLGLLFGVVVRRGDRTVGHQQRVGVRRLVEDRDAHVAEGADDRVDRLGFDQPLGQVVVDLGVGQEAALLAELDQLPSAACGALELFLGDALLRVRERFLDQRLFLRPLVLRLLLGVDRRRNVLDDFDVVADRIVVDSGEIVITVEIVVDPRLGFGSALARRLRTCLRGTRLRRSSGLSGVA